MKSKSKLWLILLVILGLSIPANSANALPQTTLPPIDIFQLPWEQEIAWVSLDGFDNGLKRGPLSPHRYTNGGAVDFAPREDMVPGEDTSEFWVTAAANGTVIKKYTCGLQIAHAGGWTTEYQFLANIQVSVGEAVHRNQKLGIIADGVRDSYCIASEQPNMPHLHFSLRPEMRGATFAGWEISYNALFNKTTFTKNGQSAQQFEPLLNTPALQIITVGDITWDTTYRGSIDKYRYEKWHFTLSETTAFALNATGITSGLEPLIVLLDSTGKELARGKELLSSVQPAGEYFFQIQPQAGQGFYNLRLTKLEDEFISIIAPENVKVGEKITVTIYFNLLPPSGYTSAEITCSYDYNLLEASNMTAQNIFGTDPVTALSGPQDGSFIYAIAGSHGQRATEKGAVFSFDVKGLQEGRSTISCSGKTSQGDGTLTGIGTSSLDVDILANTSLAPESTRGLAPVPQNNDVDMPQLNGQVTASKATTVSLYDAENSLITSATVQADDTFTLFAPVGIYLIIAEANGFLDAQGNISISSESTDALKEIILLAGDIDDNNVIDQLDALGIAMNYNTTSPEAADLNGDGIINLLDLEILAQNYRFSGVLVWE
ncbi:MAG: peptidoglycan DD-metalloendopeptidase family protein [Anaerolineae bacterium]|nr:peptidoglycan DD-metalloendopeptidase family protein [Anaerolineae bacterium]MBT6814678.1 peptidoglycan DD-metalloendopeptidase family protein [Anaerolineae bacterium]MBT7775334.1 peptidoglycan DD-metalloendopeptidase family protein [Anaerolineae bacterium]